MYGLQRQYFTLLLYNTCQLYMQIVLKRKVFNSLNKTLPVVGFIGRIRHNRKSSPKFHTQAVDNNIEWKWKQYVIIITIIIEHYYDKIYCVRPLETRRRYLILNHQCAFTYIYRSERIKYIICCYHMCVSLIILYFTSTYFAKEPNNTNKLVVFSFPSAL